MQFLSLVETTVKGAVSAAEATSAGPEIAQDQKTVANAETFATLAAPVAAEVVPAPSLLTSKSLTVVPETLVDSAQTKVAPQTFARLDTQEDTQALSAKRAPAQLAMLTGTTLQMVPNLPIKEGLIAATPQFPAEPEINPKSPLPTPSKSLAVPMDPLRSMPQGGESVAMLAKVDAQNNEMTVGLNTMKRQPPPAESARDVRPVADGSVAQPLRIAPKTKPAPIAPTRPTVPEPVAIQPSIPNAKEPPLVPTVPKAAPINDPSVPIISRPLPESVINEASKRDAPLLQAAPTLGKTVVPREATVSLDVEKPKGTETPDEAPTRASAPETKTPALVTPTKAATSRVLINGQEYRPIPMTPSKSQVAQSVIGLKEAPQAVAAQAASSQTEGETVPTQTPIVESKTKPNVDSRDEKRLPHAHSVEPEATQQTTTSRATEPSPPQKPVAPFAVSDPNQVKPQAFDSGDARPQNAPFAATDSVELDRPTAPDAPKLANQQPSTQRTDLARSVANQMAAAVAQSGDGTIDIRLSPEDLGRVRLALTPGDLGMTVNITAERPDTLDLVRRHIDLLAQDLRQSGFQNLAFNFGQNPQDQRSDFDLPEQLFTSSEETLPDAPDAAPVPTASTGRLDIRL